MGKSRLVHKVQFTTVPTAGLRDAELSTTAKFVLALLWSLPDDWSFSVAGLASIAQISKGTMTTALQALEDHGYITRQFIRHNGKFAGIDYVLNETAVTSDRQPYTQKPYPKNWYTENQYPVFSTLHKQDKQKQDKQKQEQQHVNNLGDDVVVRGLLSVGVKKEIAVEYIRRYGLERVQEVLGVAERQAKSNPPAWIGIALREDWVLSSAPTAKAAPDFSRSLKMAQEYVANQYRVTGDPSWSCPSDYPVHGRIGSPYGMITLERAMQLVTGADTNKNAESE